MSAIVGLVVLAIAVCMLFQTLNENIDESIGPRPSGSVRAGGGLSACFAPPPRAPQYLSESRLASHEPILNAHPCAHTMCARIVRCVESSLDPRRRMRAKA